MAKAMHARRDSSRRDGELSVEALQRRAEELEIEIEEAAVRGDADLFVHLQMARAALPRRIREAKAAPVRAEIERLEAEERELAAEEERVREQPPELSETETLRGVNPAAHFNQVLGGVVERRSAAGKELVEARRRLEKIERKDEGEEEQ